MVYTFQCCPTRHLLIQQGVSHYLIVKSYTPLSYKHGISLSDRLAAYAMSVMSSYKEFEHAMQNKKGGKIEEAIKTLIQLLKNLYQPPEGSDDVDPEFVANTASWKSDECFTMEDILHEVINQPPMETFRIINPIRVNLLTSDSKSYGKIKHFSTADTTLLPNTYRNTPDTDVQFELEYVEDPKLHQIHLLDTEGHRDVLCTHDPTVTQVTWELTDNPEIFGAAMWTFIGLILEKKLNLKKKMRPEAAFVDKCTLSSIF